MTYLVPICDLESSNVWIEKFEAKSIEECQDKIINYFQQEYSLEDSDNLYLKNYHEFCKELKSYDLLIGNIEDSEIL